MQKLSECDFTVLDLEVSGGKLDSCGILEIGMVKIQNERITDSFSSLVYSEYPIQHIVQKMTGISAETIKDSPPFSSLADTIAQFINSDILIVHNSPFDIQILNVHMKKLGMARFTNSVLCTVKLGHLLAPEAENRKLETLAKHFNIDLKDRHRALGDAMATAEIFLTYLKLLKEKGVETLSQLYFFMEKANASSTPH
jgi:DNA polymerase III epsilon subunit family exonuclease